MMFVHLTNALETDSIMKAFKEVADAVIFKNLRKGGLLPSVDP